MFVNTQILLNSNFYLAGISWLASDQRILIYHRLFSRTSPKWLLTNQSICKLTHRFLLVIFIHLFSSSLLTSRLASLSPSTPYGSMPVHASLWESATVTSDSLRARLAIIHLVHEARGLDVNPATIERFRKAGDTETVKVMEIIHADEVTHVTSGHRWFTWVCGQENVDPITAFREEVKKGWRGDVKGPFNVEDREKAGLTPPFYEGLRGEMGFVETEKRDNSMATVILEYEGRTSTI